MGKLKDCLCNGCLHSEVCSHTYTMAKTREAIEYAIVDSDYENCVKVEDIPWIDVDICCKNYMSSEAKPKLVGPITAQRKPLFTPAEFRDEMAELYHKHIDAEDDQKAAHMEMDVRMVNLLRSLGYGEGCDIFTVTPKWFA